MPKVAALVAVIAAFVGVGCGSAERTVNSGVPAKQEAEDRAYEKLRAHEEAAYARTPEGKRKAAQERAAQAAAARTAREKAECPGLEPGWKCTPQRAHEEVEYKRRKAEGEQRLKEMQRRANGEQTPEEQEQLEKDRQESQKEVEAIKEGQRLKDREEGKIP